MISRIRNASIIGVFAGLGTMPAHAGHWVYTFQSAQMTELPDPYKAGAYSEARDINIHGQIVGWANTIAGVPNAWLYEPSGVYKQVGIPITTTYTSANGINNVGEVVGTWWDGDFDRGFHWHPSTGFEPLRTGLQPGEAYNDQYHFVAAAINDFGMVVGSAAGSPFDDIPFTPCFDNVPIYWSRPDQRPKLTHCPSEPGGPNAATAVNNYGWIAGFETTKKNRGFRWHQGNISYVPWPVGGAKDGISIQAINQGAAVAGRGVALGLDGGGRALYWDGTSEASQLLGVLPGGKRSRAEDLNDQHFVTGYSERPLSTEAGVLVGERAFLWSSQIGMVELPASTTRPPGPLYKKCRANALTNFKYTGNSQAGNSPGVIRVVGYCGGQETPHAVVWDVTLSRYWLP